MAASRPAGVERDRFSRAAAVALHRYPGPAGQLLQREILGHVELGHRFVTASGLVAQLVDDLLRESRRGGADARSRAVDTSPPRSVPLDQTAYCFE